MRKIAAGSLCLLALFAVASEAWAQGRGFGDGFDGRMGPRIDWYPNMDSIVRSASGGGGNDPAMMPNDPDPFRRFFRRPMGDKKYIFAYVRPMNEDRDPNEFNNQDLSVASRQEWAFVRINFDKEDAHLKAWGVKTAPVVVGCDIHGNEFWRTPSFSIDNLRTLLKTIPDQVVKYELRLRSQYQNAIEAAKTDETKAVKALVDLATLGKPGYKEVTEAQARLSEIAEAAFRRVEVAESVSLDTGLEALDEIVKLFRTAAPGIQAEIRIARLERHRDNPAGALARLLKIVKLDPRVYKKEVDEASALVQEISRDGDAKIDSALAAGERAKAKETLRRIAKDYAGTDAGKRAGDEAKKPD